MLNHVDLQLITELEKNGRTSYASLAKSVGAGSSTVAKRLNSLLKEGVLTIQTIPNPYKMSLNAISFICMNVNVDGMDNICERLKGIFNVFLIAATFGRFNLVLGVYFSSWDELHDFISSELSGKGDIDEIELFFIKDIKKPYPMNPDTALHHKVDPVYVDEIDYKIIKELSENGRSTGYYLANKLGISTSLVSKRLNRLLDELVIQVRAQINPTALGLHSNTFIFARIEHGREEEIFKNLSPHKQVVSIMTLENGYDIYIGTITKNTQDLHRFVKKNMGSSHGVVSMETLIIGDIIRRRYGTFDVDLPCLHIDG
jgi:Lrp/AsnC family transcriptional regulator for asnA, asnC and gidA